MAVYRVYTEKKAPFAVEAQALLREIREVLLIPSVTGVRLLNRYDIEGVGEALFEKCLPIVFFEPQLDEHFFALPEGGALGCADGDQRGQRGGIRAQGCCQV